MILPLEIPSIKEEFKIKKEEDNFMEITDEFVDLNFITPTIEYDEALNDISIIYEDFLIQLKYPSDDKIKIKDDKIETKDDEMEIKDDKMEIKEEPIEVDVMEKSNEEESTVQKPKLKVSIYKEGPTVKNIASCLYQISSKERRKTESFSRSTIQTRSQSKKEDAVTVRESDEATTIKSPTPEICSRKLKTVSKRKRNRSPRDFPKRKKKTNNLPRNVSQVKNKRSLKLLKENQVKLIKGIHSYSCSACGYIGKQKPQVVVHIRRHLGIKPYACEHCDYASVERSHLSRHLKVHFASKPHKCPTCSYSCIQKSSLRKHLLKCNH